MVEENPICKALLKAKIANQNSKANEALVLLKEAEVILTKDNPKTAK